MSNHTSRTFNRWGGGGNRWWVVEQLLEPRVDFSYWEGAYKGKGVTWLGILS